MRTKLVAAAIIPIPKHSFSPGMSETSFHVRHASFLDSTKPQHRRQSRIVVEKTIKPKLARIVAPSTDTVC